LSRISVIVDTGDTFITGVVDTAEQLSLVTTKPAINLFIYGAAWLNYGAAWLSYGAAWLSYGAAWLS
jgi:hypothetical protein